MRNSQRIILLTASALLGILGGNAEVLLAFCASVAAVTGGTYIRAGARE